MNDDDGDENDERWERGGVGTGWHKRLMKEIIEEGNCEEDDDE